ncbi:MAG TPA: AraC family transcriptional regulator, partial [Anaerostipes hadrus]|nr:AraC family transcriptional regulator [Anaerostipes hadrus]
MTISDISMENGFPNNKAFSKAFYKKYGIMPAEFRKRQKSAINKISN